MEEKEIVLDQIPKEREAALDTAKTSPVAPSTPKADPGFITQRMLDAQLSPVMDMLQGIAKSIESKTPPVKDEAAPISSPLHPLPYIPVNPEWRQIVNEVLGEDFGMEVRYSSGGDVIMFDLLVPLAKSNASREYLEITKVDRRTKSLNPAAGGIGVRQWCEIVKKNLAHPR